MAGATELALSEQPVEAQPLSPTRLLLRRLLRKRIAMMAIAFIFLFYFLGTTAPLLSKAGMIHSYTDQNLEQSLEGPSWSHPFGTDRLGRDQLARVIWASQTTVIVTLATLLTGGLLLGVSMGLLSGYVGGWIDSLIMRIGETTSALPTIFLIILINATLKDRVHAIFTDVENFTGIDGLVKSGVQDYFLIFGALSIFSWFGLARIIRSQVLALRETEFILAARSLGAPTRRLLFRHLLPNVSNTIIVILSLSLAGIAGSEILLTWFGIGIQPPRPSFGILLFETASVRVVNDTPWLLAFPGAILAGLLFSFNLLGDALTDVFTPRAR